MLAMQAIKALQQNAKHFNGNHTCLILHKIMQVSCII